MTFQYQKAHRLLIAVSYFRSCSAPPHIFCHQAILQIREACSLLEMVFRQKQVPQSGFLCLGFQFVDYGWICAPSLLAFPQLCVEEYVCGDAFFLDELFYLYYEN